MRDEVTQHRFVLFDAAIVPIESIRSLVDDGVCARCLYEQWGAGAERVSPWVLADGPGVRELAQDMRASRTHAFGVSSLMSRVPMDELAEHLMRLQYLFCGHDRYFLRYADGRAFADLWEVLRPEQRTCLLGPVQRWNARACAPRDYMSGESEDRLFGSGEGQRPPLRLMRAQFGRLIRAQRITQRWAVWETEQPLLARKFTPARLRDLAVGVGDWLQTHQVVAGPTLRAVGMAALRSNGDVLESPDFPEAVAEHARKRETGEIRLEARQGQSSGAAA